MPRGYRERSRREIRPFAIPETEIAMSKGTTFVLAGLLIGGSINPASPETKSGWEYPAIRGYGKVRPYPDAAARPSPDQTYKVLFDITEGAETPEKPNSGLDHVAQLINAFTLAGVPPERLKLALVVHGSATPSILKDERYRNRFGNANPNTDLIQALKKAGVRLYVCGQALAEKDFEPADVNPDVTVALSALTVLPLYQMDGYVLIPD
jgi:intracellular sulfur oxidation DsrE/DsrF family protein